MGNIDEKGVQKANYLRYPFLFANFAPDGGNA